MAEVATDDAAAPMPVTSRSDAVTVYNPDPHKAAHMVWLARRLAGPLDDVVLSPLRRVLEVAAEQGCRSVVVEEQYSDADYRSEFSSFHSRRHERLEQVARRFHLFSRPLTVDDVYQLPADMPASEYLGYAVLRPTELGPLGRTLLRPPASMRSGALCTVTEFPSLFGNDLEICGVPFMQQDGELLRCAHAAAWLCHYVAWERKVIGRRLTAALAGLPGAEGSKHRALPSNGLTGEQLQGIFSAIGLPAIFYDVADLPEPPAPWPMPQTRAPHSWPSSSKKQRERENHERALQRERLERVACKYLNSGFPVVVLTRGTRENHAFTLVGWQQTPDGVLLLACDDQVGPYEIIEDLGAEDQVRGEWAGLMIPLPEKVILNGEAAETRARDIVIAGAARADTSGSQQDRDFKSFVGDLETLRGGDISIRSRLMRGRTLKRAMATQGRTAEALQVLRFATLPQWVWLVEFQSRSLRNTGQPCVKGEIVFDSTSNDLRPRTLASSTLNEAKDASLIRQKGPANEALAPGTKDPWPSLINPESLAEAPARVA